VGTMDHPSLSALPVAVLMSLFFMCNLVLVFVPLNCVFVISLICLQIAKNSPVCWQIITPNVACTNACHSLKDIFYMIDSSSM